MARPPRFTSNPRIPFQMSTERPPLPPPDGKPLIVHILVALERWRFDDHMPRHIMPAPHGLRPVPDVPNWSWAGYGMRCGMPRLLRVLGERGIKADACINASVLDAYPSVAEAVRDAGWEFQGHGISVALGPRAGARVRRLLRLRGYRASTRECYVLSRHMPATSKRSDSGGLDHSASPPLMAAARAGLARQTS